MRALLQVLLFLPCAVLFFHSSPLRAQCLIEEQAILIQDPRDPSEGDDFGGAIVVDGDVAAVIASDDKEARNSAGALFIFRRTDEGWVQEAKFPHRSAEDTGSLAGGSTPAVALDGDTIIVGADEQERCFVYTFDGAAWSQSVILTSPDTGEDVEHFGAAVAISGDVIAVGAETDRGFFSNGACFVYRRDGKVWELEASLEDPSSISALQGFFGKKVALSGDVLVVGSPGSYESPALHVGACHVFRHDGGEWELEQSLRVEDDVGAEYFGSALGVSGDVIVASGFPGGLSESVFSSTLVFRWDGSEWIEEQELTVDGDEAIAESGNSIAIDGEVIVVGTPHTFTEDEFDTAFHVFRFDGSEWVLEESETDLESTSESAKGAVVAFDGARIVAGFHGGSEPGNRTHCRTYEFDGETWIESARFLPVDGGHDTDFGVRLGLSGDLLVVSANKPSTAAPAPRGACDVFRRRGTEWSRKATLIPPFSDFEGGTSTDLAADGDVVALGFPFAGPNGKWHGACVVYRDRGTEWSLEQEILPPVTDGSYRIGQALALDGDRILVTASGSGPLDERPFAILYRFDGVEWVLEQELTRDEVELPWSNPTSVALQGDTAIIAGPEAVAVFRFDGAAWASEQVLEPFGEVINTQFGSLLALDGSWLAVGASFDGSSRPGCYLFRREEVRWLDHQWIDLIGAPGFASGRANLDLSGNLLLVGAPTTTFDGVYSGAALLYSFELGEFVLNQAFVSSSTEHLDRFGNSVAIEGSTIVVGERNFYVDTDRGVHVFTIDVTEQPSLLSGDANDDGAIDLGDAVLLLKFLFLGVEESEEPCAFAVDVNHDGSQNILDPFMLLKYLFAGGQAPPYPFLECEPLTTCTVVDCETQSECD